MMNSLANIWTSSSYA